MHGSTEHRLLSQLQPTKVNWFTHIHTVLAQIQNMMMVHIMAVILKGNGHVTRIVTGLLSTRGAILAQALP